MNQYPPQLPPPPPPPGSYNPYNPYGGYDPGIDYVPWLPGRQGPRFLPYAFVIGLVLVCSCCSFITGMLFGIELPGFLVPSQSPSRQVPTDEPLPEQELQPQNFNWRVIYPET